MNPLKVALIAIRPKTLIVAISPIFIATILFYVERRQFDISSKLIFINILVSALLIQIISNIANDLFDFLKGADNQDRKGPSRVVQAGLLSVKKAKKLLIVLTILTIFSGIPLFFFGGTPILIIGLTAILFAILYTATPFALAYNGLGELFVFIYFGPIATYGTYYLLSGYFNLVATLAGIAPGLLATSLLLANNIRDYKEDKKNNKNTLVVKLGEKISKNIYTTTIFLPIVIHIFLGLYLNKELTASSIILYIGIFYYIDKNNVNLFSRSTILIATYLLSTMCFLI